MCLFDFFDRDLDFKTNGTLESLQTNIENNFSIDQILIAFHKKFDFLANKNLFRCVIMSEAFFCKEKFFKEFRAIFNTAKLTKSDEFISELIKWFGKDYEGGIKLRVELLREDMKKW